MNSPCELNRTTFALFENQCNSPTTFDICAPTFICPTNRVYMQIPVICSLSIGIPKTASRPCTTYLYTLLRHMGAMGHSSHETHTHLYLFCTLSIHLCWWGKGTIYSMFVYLSPCKHVVVFMAAM